MFSYIKQATVTLLSFLHVQVPTAWTSQKTLRLRHVKQTHSTTVQETEREIPFTAAAEELTGHKPAHGSIYCVLHDHQHYIIRQSQTLTQWRAPWCSPQAEARFGTGSACRLYRDSFPGCDPTHVPPLTPHLTRSPDDPTVQETWVNTKTSLFSA